jgi:hypothetical protein
MRRLVLLLILMCPARASAEWQLRPFLGATFAPSTSFIIPIAAPLPNKKIAFGMNAVLVGRVFGIDMDFGRTPGFFQSGNEAESQVLRSSVTTVTGNMVVALPRHLAQYTLRPYFVGGAGLIHARIQNQLGALPLASTLAAMDVGGGVTGFVSDRYGLSWDVRRFWSVGGQDRGVGLSIGPEQLSFWRANMALAIRY